MFVRKILYIIQEKQYKTTGSTVIIADANLNYFLQQGKQKYNYINIKLERITRHLFVLTIIGVKQYEVSISKPDLVNLGY